MAVGIGIDRDDFLLRRVDNISIGFAIARLPVLTRSGRPIDWYPRSPTLKRSRDGSHRRRHLEDSIWNERRKYRASRPSHYRETVRHH